MAQNEIILYGTVGASWWDEEYFTAASVREMLDGRDGPLTVRINSGGGFAHEGQAIYTMLRDYAAEKGPVEVIVDAVAMSAASLIAMAGDTRVMRTGSYLLIHDPAQPFTESRGTEADHLKLAAQLRVVSGAYAEVYASRAGISKEDARTIMRDETILDGETAVLMGFATATEAAEAVTAAQFDYRIYAHAPESLRERSRSLGAPQGKAAVMAMMAGQTRPHTPKEALMADRNQAAGDNSADDKKKAPAKEQETTPTQPEKSPEGAPLPSRDLDPHAPPETPAKVEARAERARIQGIRDLVMMAKLPETVASELIEREVSLEAARTQIVAKWKDEGDVDTPMHGRTTMRVVADARDKFATGVEKALVARVGLKGGERNEFSSMHSLEMARTALTMAGVKLAPTADKNQIAEAALNMRSPITMVGEHTTSDFGNILGTVARRSMLEGWEEEDEQFGLLTGRAQSLPDFRTSTMVGLGFFENLAEKPEGAEYKYGTLADRSRTIALATYGKAFAITREAIINDELGMILGQVPRKMGRAARRTVGNLVWNILLANAGLGVTLSDGKTLFHADHGNVGNAAALSVDSLGAALQAMRVQKADGLTIGMRARYLIVPAALEFKAREIVNSAVYPGTNRGMQANPVAGSVEIIVDPRLDAVSTTGWYLMADPAVRDTIMLAYLDGNDTPFMDEQPIWKTDGREWKVRIDAGVAPGDYQAFFRNAGV